jgi:uncharacterized membrane protein YoaK (UPF0700 family)
MRGVGGLLIVLAGASGWLDAGTYLRFHLFTANMTGNTVLLGLALAGSRGAPIQAAFAAIAAFVIGSFAGTAVAGASARAVRGASKVLFIEAVLLAVLAALWWLLPLATFAQRVTLIAAGACAMGLQQAATVRLRPTPTISTTYMSGTVERIGSGLRNMFVGDPKTLTFNGLLWLMFVVAAVTAGRAAPQASVLFAVVPCCIVSLVVARLCRNEAAQRASADAVNPARI